MPVAFPSMPLQEQIIDLRTGAMSRAWIAWFEEYLIRINSIEFEQSDTSSSVTGIQNNLESIEGILNNPEIQSAFLYDTLKTTGYITDNAIPRGDGGKKILQDSTATIDDNGLLTAEGIYVNGEYFNATDAKSADYTILDDDAALHIEVTTGATDKTITLPTLADNIDRILHITKVDAGAGTVIIDGEGAETISGDATRTILFQYTTAQLKAGTTEWLLI